LQGLNYFINAVLDYIEASAFATTTTTISTTTTPMLNIIGVGIYRRL